MDKRSFDVEAVKASAERKLARGDVRGCRKLFDQLCRSSRPVDGLEQLLVVLEVHEAVLSRRPDEDVDHYSVLQLPALCDDEPAIKKAFRRMALLLHPDKNKTVGADEAFKHAKAAHDCLTNRRQKDAYDIKYMTRDTIHQQQSASLMDDFHARCFVCQSLVLCRGDALGQLVRCPTCQSPFVALEVPDERSMTDAMSNFFTATHYSPLDLSHGGGFSSWEQSTAFHLNAAAVQLQNAAKLFQGRMPGFEESMNLFQQQAASFSAMADAAAAAAVAASSATAGPGVPGSSATGRRFAS